MQAALVTPQSGELAEYGQAGAIALGLWAALDSVSLQVFDAHPDPLAALRAARASRPDLLFGPYGSGPAVAVADAVAAAGGLMWNHGGARVQPGPHVVNVLAPASSYWDGALSAVADFGPTVRVLHGASGFGRTVADGALATARRLGLDVARQPLPLPLESAEIDGDVILVAGGFADERAAASVLLPAADRRLLGFVAAGVDEVLADFGRRREGLLGPTQWLADTAPVPDEGPSAADFVIAYRQAAGTDPPYPAAQAFATGLVAARCLREAGSSEPDALSAAARALDCTTLFDRFRLDPATGAQVGHRVLTVQWQDGARRVIWPPDRATASLRH